MPELTARRRINVRAIIVRDGKLLAVKHRTDDRGEANYYAAPGGGLDPLESLHDGLAREIVEELGITPVIGRLLFIQQFPSTRQGYEEELEFFFEVTNVDDFQTIDLSTSSHGDELATCEFVDPHAVMIYPTLLQSINLSDYLEQSSPTLVVNNLHENE